MQCIRNFCTFFQSDDPSAIQLYGQSSAGFNMSETESTSDILMARMSIIQHASGSEILHNAKNPSHSKQKPRFEEDAQRTQLNRTRFLCDMQQVLVIQEYWTESPFATSSLVSLGTTKLNWTPATTSGDADLYSVDKNCVESVSVAN